MPPLDDRRAIRDILEHDRPWAAYALADLSPELFPSTRWFAHADLRPAIVLVFAAFGIPVVVATGTPRDVIPLLDEAEAELGPGRELYFNTRPELEDWLRAHHDVRRMDAMHRMVFDPGATVAEGGGGTAAGVVPLGHQDLDALRVLYSDGEAAGEAPDFFTPGMLAHGTYRGIREGGQLVAAAGTHVCAPGPGVAAIGNVYTRRDHRGRGLGRTVTAAVLDHLRTGGFESIVLNVAAANRAAIHVYERLGFRPYCRYHETIAVRT